MKVKDKIYLFVIELDFLKDAVIQELKEYKIIGVNSKCIAINDEYFTTISTDSKTNYRLHEEYNKVSIIQSKYEKIFDYIRGSLYTSDSSNKSAYKRIKAELEKYIQEKHGRYCNAVTMLDKIEI